MLGILYLSVFLFGGMMFLALCGMAAEKFCEIYDESWENEDGFLEEEGCSHKKAC